MLGDSVKENNTVENLARLFKAAKDQGFGVFISPHYLYPTDQAWQFGGAVEKMMLDDKEFCRPARSASTGFRLRGRLAGALQALHRGRQDGRGQPAQGVGPSNATTSSCSSASRIDKVILAGMLANLCVESHLRELLEQGFEVAVVKDATAAPGILIGDGYKAAIVNYGFLANAVLTTDEAVKAMK